MPDYATTAQLTARFEDDATVAHLTDNPGGSIDTDVLTEVLEGAESFINSFVAKRYLVPVVVSGDTGLAQMFKKNTLDLAQYDLLARGDLVSEAKKSLRDNVVQWCKDIAKGVIVLPSASTPTSTASRDPVVDYGYGDADSDSDRVFNRDKVKAL